MALSKIIENSISDGAVASAKLKDFSAAVDLNGVELILDADQDTSITADTDDRIDFKIAGVEHISLSNSSGDTVIKPMVDAKDIIFQQYDGNKVFEINDANFVSVGGNSSAPGEIRLYEDTDLGSHYVGFKAGNNTASVSYVLPLADGTSGQALTTDSSGTLSWSTISANTPTSADGQSLGSVALEWSDLYLADGGQVLFGNDQDITLTHNADTGLTLNGILVTTGLTIGSAAITEAELEILDGANVTTAELNIIDGNTSATSTTVADADRVVMNDNGTMVQVAVTDLAAYFDDEITAMPNLVTTAATTVGALNSGSITSGFGTINTGSSTITTTGAITGGSLVADDVTVDGKVITMTGSSSDTATITVGTNGTLDIVTTDDSAAAANIQITADGTAELAGTTVTLDSSGGITLDADGGTITFADGGSSLGTITSSGYSGTAAVATTVTVTDNESTNENNVITFVAGADADGGNVGLESDGNLTYNPSTGTLTTTNIVVSGTQTITNSVTMNANNAVVFEGSTADANETTLTSIDATADHTISLPNQSGTLPVLAAASATQITSTPEELNILDGVTSTAAELNLLDGSSANTVVNSKAVVYGSSGELAGTLSTAAQTNITSLGTLTTLTVDDITLNGSTISDGADLTLDVGGDIILDAAGNDTIIKFDGSTLLTISNSSSDAVLEVGQNDKDFIIKGQDGGSTITPFTLDMSAGGDLFLTGGLIDLKNDGSAVSQIKFYCESSNAHAQTLIGAPHSESATNTLTLPSSGGNSYLVSRSSTDTLTNKTLTTPVIAEIDATSDFTIDAGSDIVLDADGGKIKLSDAGTQWGELFNNSGFHLISKVSDQDVVVKGNDGGSEITALTIDMSAAGAATFNNDVTAFSDARLKDNVETIPNALETVCAMRGVNFTRNDNNDQPGTGVIAQEMQEVFPVVVKENNDEDNTLSVSYGNLVGVLIESIKELKAEIDELKGK